MQFPQVRRTDRRYPQYIESLHKQYTKTKEEMSFWNNFSMIMLFVELMIAFNTWDSMGIRLFGYLTIPSYWYYTQCRNKWREVKVQLIKEGYHPLE
jgi:hypothetical protein